VGGYGVVKWEADGAWLYGRKWGRGSTKCGKMRETGREGGRDTRLDGRSEKDDIKRGKWEVVALKKGEPGDGGLGWT
jgi:hypothetical protein